MNPSKVDRNRMENNRYIVRINQYGEVASIYDKVENRNLMQWPVMFEYLPDNALLYHWGVKYLAIS